MTCTHLASGHNGGKGGVQRSRTSPAPVPGTFYGCLPGTHESVAHDAGIRVSLNAWAAHLLLTACVSRGRPSSALPTRPLRTRREVRLRGRRGCARSSLAPFPVPRRYRLQRVQPRYQSGIPVSLNGKPLAARSVRRHASIRGWAARCAAPSAGSTTSKGHRAQRRQPGRDTRGECPCRAVNRYGHHATCTAVRYPHRASSAAMARRSACVSAAR